MGWHPHDLFRTFGMRTYPPAPQTLICYGSSCGATHHYSTFGTPCQYLHKISTIDRCDYSKVIFRTFGTNCYKCVNNCPFWAVLGLTRRILALRAEHKRSPHGAGDRKGASHGNHVTEHHQARKQRNCQAR